MSNKGKKFSLPHYKKNKMKRKRQQYILSKTKKLIISINELNKVSNINTLLKESGLKITRHINRIINEDIIVFKQILL